MGFDSPLWLLLLIMPLTLFLIALYTSPERHISISTLEQWKKRRSLNLPRPEKRKIRLLLNNILTALTLSLIIMALSNPFLYTKADKTNDQEITTKQYGYNVGIISADIMEDKLYLNIFSTDTKKVVLNDSSIKLKEGYNNIILNQIPDKIEIHANDEDKSDNALDISQFIMTVNFRGERGELYNLIDSIQWVKITDSTDADLFIINKADMPPEYNNLISILTPLSTVSLGKDILIPDLNISSGSLESLNYISEGPYPAKELINVDDTSRQIAILAEHNDSRILALIKHDGITIMASSFDFDNVLEKDPNFSIFIYETLNLFREQSGKQQLTTNKTYLRLANNVETPGTRGGSHSLTKQSIVKPLIALNIILVFICLLLQLKKS